MWTKLKRDPFVWIMSYMMTKEHLFLNFNLWIICTIYALYKVSSQKSKATTSIRKYFHALVVIVFTSGIVLDANFLYLASIVVFCAMLLVEHIRLHNIEPFASLINKSYHTFKDEKDVGDLVLTNLYLLSGVSLPLWITTDLQKADTILLMSGVLSVGIGDSFASIVGSKYGKLKLFKSKKTLEGLLASILSQLTFVQILQILKWATFKPLPTVIPIIVTSLVETISTQVGLFKSMLKREIKELKYFVLFFRWTILLCPF